MTKIYKEFLKFNNKKQAIESKRGQSTQINIYPKVHKGPMST